MSARPRAAVSFGHDTSDSESNGSLMRISPLGVHLWRSEPDAVAALAAQDAQLTHESETCVDAAAVYAVAISMGVALRTASMA